MDLKGLVGRPLFFTEFVELDQQLVQVLGATTMHPAIAPRSAAQCGVGMSTDEDRDGLRRRGTHLGLGNVVELAVELEVVTGSQPPDDLDAFVHALATLGEGHVHQFVVLGPRTGTDAEPETVTRQCRNGRGLLGHQGGRADRQFEYEDVEPQRRGHRAERSRERQRLDERFVLQEFTVPIGRVRILRIRLVGIRQAVGDGHTVITGRLGRLGQGNVVRRIGHGLGEGEPHSFLLECLRNTLCCRYYAL
ncbi:Uncharacterised protein [Mycobacteroides abscessus subsp. massiliense]|nr:Uncharacterised protein [Mycobacteroides abscessus subsp. massiliense]